MASFPDWSSILPIFCPFCSPSRCFCHLSPVQRPVLHGFRSSDQNELFNNLVAQFVGASTVARSSRSTTNTNPRSASCLHLNPLIPRIGFSILLPCLILLPVG